MEVRKFSVTRTALLAGGLSLVGLLIYAMKNPSNMQLTNGNFLQKIKAFFQNLIDWYD